MFARSAAIASLFPLTATPAEGSPLGRKELGDWHNLSTGFQGCPIAQGLCVVLDVRQNMRDVGRFLCSHSAVLVEIEWLVAHEARRHRCADRQPNRQG